LLGCALAWGGLVIAVLRPLYDYAWFVGLFVSGGAYSLLMKSAPVARGLHEVIADSDAD
jgi:NCS1 family nucleobase:cation symporter-1